VAAREVGVSTKRRVKTCVPLLARLFRTSPPVFTERLYQHRGRHGRTSRCVRKGGKRKSIRSMSTIRSEWESDPPQKLQPRFDCYSCSQLRLRIKPLRDIGARLVYHDCNIVPLRNQFAIAAPDYFAIVLLRLDHDQKLVHESSHSPGGARLI
jgi:hypothetical protein